MGRVYFPFLEVWYFIEEATHGLHTISTVYIGLELYFLHGLELFWHGWVFTGLYKNVSHASLVESRQKYSTTK